LPVLNEHTSPVPAEWNETEISYSSRQATLRDLLTTQVKRSPDAAALSFLDRSLSYRTLDEQSNRLANRLRQLGVVPDILVAVAAERSFEMVIALLAVVKAGGAYVPIDPGYPVGRVRFMLEDSAAPVLLTQRHLAAQLPDVDAKIVLLDGSRDAEPDWQKVASEPPLADLNPENLAYVIYTSGSTGQPKGAMNSHGAIVNRLLWMQEYYGLGRRDIVLQKTPFSFDVSVWEFFWPLMVGARLAIARPDGHKDPSYLASLIAQEGVTVCHFVPSMLQSFLAESDLSSRCATLRHVICSGEALTRPLQDRFFSQLPNAKLHNLYGPTEAAIDVTHWTCPREWDESVVPIGRPVANTQIHVLDPAGEPVAIGEVGELNIAGVQVAQGYLGRPKLTAERFVRDPFSERLGARMYKSGDLARWRPDGNLEFLGRMDHQVKILGMRIELGEIEAALETHPLVERATVLAREDVPGEKRLVAYVVPKTADHLSLAELRPHLQQRLPDYMIPPALVLMDSMPVTANGKTDRKALPPPSRKRPELEQAYLGPRTTLERFICAVWSELIHIDGIGIRDRFFDLGGNSILAAVFIRRIEQELGENIYIVSIFDSPTVAEYAQFLDRDYSSAVERRFGSETNRTSRSAVIPPLDEGDIETFKRCVPVLAVSAAAEPATRKNPRALFVLAPPRSGTTLLRVMLAGHPGLFAAAELQLLGFHTLQERRKAFSGKFSLWLEGTIRAIMELQSCDAADAQRLMEGYEESGLTTKQFYAQLQDWIGDRTLVDKSPSYALDLGSLEKAERDFEDPLYIQLIRHPYAMVKSFEKYHMEQVLFLREHDFSSRRLAELVWLSSHENTNRFLEDIPAGRKARIRYEDLVAKPELVMRDLCDALELSFHPNLADPYKDIETKMVDGIHAVSAPMGDTHLIEHGRIDAAMADGWKGVLTDDFLSERTWTLAQDLGYTRPETAVDKKKAEEQRDDLDQRRRTRRSGLGRARKLRARHRRGDDQSE